MNRLTPLERMFVEEFCRFTGAPVTEINRLKVGRRRSNPAGFVSTLTRPSVPDSFRWPERFFDPMRTAVVGARKSVMLMLMVFDPVDGRLVSIEGDALSCDWDELHEPTYWSETQVVIDQRKHN